MKEPPKQEFFDQKNDSNINVPFVSDDSGHHFFLRANVLIILTVFAITIIVLIWGVLTLRAKILDAKHSRPSPVPVASCQPRPSCLDIEPRCLPPEGANFCSPTPTPTPLVSPSPETSTEPSPEAVFCTQEAKECPDGSFVGRQGPKCEFTPCPPAL